MGTNNFVALAVIPAGTPQETESAPVDLWTVVPTNGFSPSGFSVILTGNFVGSIALLGSLDGVAYRPLTSFNAGAQPDLPVQGALEFSPQLVATLTRYIKWQVQAVSQVLSDVNITLGGELNCACAAAATSDSLVITLRNDSLVSVPANRIVHYNTVNASGNGGFLVGLPTLAAERGIGVTNAAIAPGASGPVTIAGQATVFVVGYGSTTDQLKDGPGHKVYLSADGVQGTFLPQIGQRFLSIGERIDNVSWAHYGGGLVKVLIRPSHDISYTEEFNANDLVAPYNSASFTDLLIIEFLGDNAVFAQTGFKNWLVTGLIEAVFVASPKVQGSGSGPYTNVDLFAHFKRTWSFSTNAAGNALVINAASNDFTFLGNATADVEATIVGSLNTSTIHLRVKGAGGLGMNWACTARVTALLSPVIP
jgi:hypothetical protein